MQHMAVSGDLALWIHNFLLDRKQLYSCCWWNSVRWIPVINGVPPGSVLGPILFLILISDINKDIHYTSISPFVDDTRVLKQISNIEDCNSLRKYLNKIYERSIANNMCFNSCKLKIIWYTFSNGPVINYVYLANDESEIIGKKDLGVTMSNDVTFQDHISNIAWASRKRDRTAMLTLWKAVVIPILDYCSQLCSPWTRIYIKNIESVQRTLTHCIMYISCEALKLPG